MTKRRTAAILLIVPLLVFLTGLAAWWWIMHTGSGARWALDKASNQIAGEFNANLISGDLSSGIELSNIRFKSEAMQVETGSLRLAFQADLWPLSLTISTFHADTVRWLALPDKDKEQSGKEISINLDIPFPLIFRDISLSNVEFYGSPEADAIVIYSIEATGSLSENLVLDRFVVTLPEDRLQLSGRVALAFPHALAVTFQSNGRYIFTGNLHGDVEIAELVLDTDKPATQVSGTVKQLLHSPGWDLVAEAPLLLLPLGNAEPAVTLIEVQARSTGEWPRFDLDLDATIETEWLEPAQLTLSGRGSEDSFTAQALTLDGRELSMDATGTVSWADSVRLELITTLNRIDPNVWLPEWPEEQPLNGRFKLESADDKWTLNDFSLAAANSALEATGSGSVEPQSNTVALALNWRNFSWPIAAESSTLVSESGSLRVSGRLDDWTIQATLGLQSGDFPGGELTLNGTGNEESLKIDLQEGKALGGIISGNLAWQWTGTQPFSAELAARQVRIEPLFPGYPGVLNTRFSVNGEIVPMHLAVTIHQLEGTILNLPVKGYGGFHFEKSRIFADELSLASGASSLTLDGSLYEPDGIEFSLNSDSLTPFHKNLGGNLVAEGNISLEPGSPRLLMTLSGDDLVLGSLEIQHIETLHSSGSGTTSISELVFSGLMVGQRPVESLSIRFDGEQPLQWADFRAHLEDTDVHLALNGALNDWNNPFSSGWSGELSEFEINRQGRFNLKLDQAARLSWAPTEFLLEPACLSGLRNGHMCVSSKGNLPSDLNFSADLTAIPVGLINLALDSGLIFTQVLSGKLDWSQSAATGQNAVAQFRMTPGSIRVEHDDEALLETGDGLFGFELSGGKLQKGILNLEIPGTGDIDVDFSVADFALGSESPIQGIVKVDFPDLSVLGQALPLLDSINGAIDVDLNLAGVISDPSFDGTASIQNGHFANHTSGFSFSDINITGEISNSDRAELAGTFRAGEGTGDIKTRILFENALSPKIELTLKGKSLTIIDVPDLLVVADPDIELAWAEKTLDINGRLYIPQARLSPSYIPQTSARQSEDVVIVAGELPVQEDNYLQDNPIKIRGNLEVELSKSAEIELEFARVNISGTTQFTWLDEILPIANGNFDIQGDIQAYGQELKITRGRISFPEIPANNPNLNIRAERAIYGNSQIQKAGLMVVGTAKRPIIEAYTVPMTNKDRAQTLLVTGSDFNYEQGVGAVAVGTYVLPRLYVSYGIGVFEDGNVISARYDLGGRFGVKVTSGQEDTGVDLNYTIER